jgi:hypothetical protein
MVRLLIVLSAAAGVLLTACSDGNTPNGPTASTSAVQTSQAQPTPAQTFATRTPVAREPTKLDMGPFPAATVYADYRPDSAMILDVPSGLLYRVQGGWQGLYWLDDDRLGTSSGATIDLARGEVVYDDPPANAPDADPSVSRDGLWKFEATDDVASVVEASTGRRVSLPPSPDNAPRSITYGWSPSGHLLAFGGGGCGDDPLMLLDPDTEQLVTLHTPQPRAVSYAWRPDGRGLAVAYGTSAPPEVVFVDVVDGGTTTMLIGTGANGELRTGAWNPSGTRLIVNVFAARPCPF